MVKTKKFIRKNKKTKKKYIGGGKSENILQEMKRIQNQVGENGDDVLLRGCKKTFNLKDQSSCQFRSGSLSEGCQVGDNVFVNLSKIPFDLNTINYLSKSLFKNCNHKKHGRNKTIPTCLNKCILGEISEIKFKKKSEDLQEIDKVKVKYFGIKILNEECNIETYWLEENYFDPKNVYKHTNFGGINLTI